MTLSEIGILSGEGVSQTPTLVRVPERTQDKRDSEAKPQYGHRLGGDIPGVRPVLRSIGRLLLLPPGGHGGWPRMGMQANVSN